MVQNVAHRGPNTMGDILEREWRTCNNQKSPQGPQNSKQSQEVSPLITSYILSNENITRRRIQRQYAALLSVLLMPLLLLPLLLVPFWSWMKLNAGNSV